MTPPRLSSRWLRTVASLAAGGASMALLVACSPAQSALQTAPVERVTMATGISSTGSLSAASEQNLGFAQGGRLTTVNVRVGDRVPAGQVLASIDPEPARDALDAQKAQLRAAEAALERVKDSPGVDDANDSLSQAKDILEAVTDQVGQQDDADRVAIVNAERQVSADQNAVTSAQNAQSAACEAVRSRIRNTWSFLPTLLQSSTTRRSTVVLHLDLPSLPVKLCSMVDLSLAA